MVPLLVVAEASSDGRRVSARGEIDIANADDVVAALLDAEAGSSTPIVLDLSGVTFIDSTGIRLLLEASKRSRENGNELSVISSPEVDRVIEICGIRGWLPLV